MAEPDKAPDPKAAELKYTYPDAAKDDAAIKKVETAIATHFPESYAAGLQESANNAPIKESEVQAKKADAENQAKQEAVSNPDKVKKEATDDPPGKLAQGAPTKPEIKKASPAKAGPTEPQKGAGEGPPKKAGAGGKQGAGGAEGAPKASPELVLAAAASGDGNIDKFLNEYPHKSPETTERLSKIKEMAGVAKGFDGQLESYVKNGDGPLATAKAGMMNFLGKKDMEAAFGENPYAKVQGGLGTLMRGLSRFQAIVSIVGNVCGKLGMVLTVVGLLGMIFPPLGAAVSAVARVLNVVGIICDVLGLALGGVLTGLNGVVLAKQIAKGASNEEKAATADMMVTEATSASGHIMSLAMTYGPGFMKGFKSASKGVIGNLFAKFKGVVGKFATKALGPVANWAKNIGFKLGFGLGKGPGLMSKVWKAPGTLLEKVRDTSFVKKINNSSFMQGLERGSAKINNNSFIKGVDGFGESAGKLAGKHDVGTGGSWATRLENSAKDDAKLAAEAAEHNLAQNAGNQEKARIERDIAEKQKFGNAEFEKSTAGGHGVIDESSAVKSAQAYEEADALKAGEKDAVKGAEKDAVKEAKAAEKEAKLDEKHEEDRKEEWKKDPKRFQAETKGLETRQANIEAKMNKPGITDAEKEKLAHTAEKLKKTIDERKLIPLKASGGEVPENLWQAGKMGKEAWDQGHFKDEKGEKLESYKKVVEKGSGHADREKDEKAERHEKVEEWHAQEHAAPTTAQQVDGMLSGLDEDEDHEHEGEHEDDGKSAGGDDEKQAAAGEDKQSDPGGQDGKSQEQEKPQAAAPAKEEKKEEQKGAEVPELAYWPDLTGPGGKFMQAAKDLARMKQIAFAFHKSQVEAKKKAMETVATLATASDTATKKQEHAAAQTTSLHSTIDEANKAASSADKSGGKADEGSAKQNEGKGNSNGSAQQAPDPGEKPSMWHPIKRIWWYVKKWASEKAAAVFGWIQEKIASMILQGLCGVSMGDMKAYTSALHNRMQFSKLAGTQGVDAAGKAMAEQAKAKTESKSYSDQAMDDAKECDANITDADNFVKTVEATEQDLAAEQAKAATFLRELKSAVDAEKAKQAEEKAKAAAEASKAPPAANAGPAGAPASAGPKPAPKKKREPKKQEVSAAKVGKVTGAAGYVVTQANLIVQQITSQQTDQTSRLKDTLKKKAQKTTVATLKPGEGVVTTVKAQTATIIGAMEGVKNQTPASTAALKGLAGQVKSQAKQLDDLTASAYQQLNASFKATYDTVAKQG